MSKNSEQVVLERRLKPIYDAIDLGNNKKALQEIDKFLRKHPTTQCAKQIAQALKALTLIRSERAGEAWPLIKEVEDVVDASDEITLQALSHCFKEAFAPERISALYESICERQPKNEQHLTHLFMSYVRVFNYKQQQRVALKLFREFQRNPYYFWNVMSIVMQAIKGDEKLAQTTLYPLAEKMVSKMIEVNSIQAGTVAECDLYVMILENSNQYAKAAQFLLTSNLTHRRVGYSSQFAMHKILSLQQKANEHSSVVERCIIALNNDFDDWTLWTVLLDSTFVILKSELSDDERHSLVNRVADLVISLITTTEASNDPLRGPYLARLALLKRCSENNVVACHQLGDPLEILFDYVKRFYSKPCCFNDLKPYLVMVEDESINNFIQKVEDFVISKNEDLKPAKNFCWLEILYYRLLFTMVEHNKLSATEKRGMISKLIKSITEYADSDLAATAYAHLGAIILWQLYVKNDTSALYELLLFMEWVKKNHPSDPLSSIILCKAYACLGCTVQVQGLVQSLDVKYIQRDTLGYLISGILEQYGRFGTATIHHAGLTAFFDQTEKEIAECLTTAYKNGNFLQVPKLVEFSERISKSLTALTADIQSLSLSACFAVKNIDQIVESVSSDQEKIDFSKIRDNRDFGVIPLLGIGETEKEFDSMKQESFNQQIDALKLTHLLMRSIAFASHSNSSFDKFSLVVCQLRDHINICKQRYAFEKHPSKFIQAPFPLFLCSLVNSAKVELLQMLLDSTENIIKFADKSLHSEIREDSASIDADSLLKLLPSMDELDANIKKSAGDLPTFSPLSVPLSLRHCSSSLQIFVFARLIIEAMEKLIVNIISSNCNQKRKKNSISVIAKKCSAIQKLNEALFLINEGISIVGVHLSDCLRFLRDKNVSPSISASYCSESQRILSNQKLHVDSSLAESYSCSTSYMLEVIKQLLKM